jgi:hypothetical protein
LVAASSGAVITQPFDFQRQIGSTGYNITEDTDHLDFAPTSRSGHVSSLTEWMQGANVEGIAYRDYRERYASGTDWDKVAREYRAQHMNGELALGVDLKGGNP